ncbi:PGC-1 and ERR-induced regulator in muscle protein 1 PPARGC1 and ESRR-induced regulator in muscle 1 [Collichthys lucidus]|uniref:PGC-1 and ERR-induced regulator in muscle protein 1 PPARGC1 and ESRR-induced regulator in muscle 1 n=1 Tax=Collichthys lucidus TaxID=240159 RepID=A0A4U5USC3_COLLU|nr:PGC-1 and ERR-induced regulator in muscle protein 1 PPARGC1 and ESRR-induced regulator in muscle 1 [Collichthys lucidus]
MCHSASKRRIINKCQATNNQLWLNKPGRCSEETFTPSHDCCQPLTVVLHRLTEMEDFEFSVEISDRDWECFFTECEECNLLPPSLAAVDDSGMSDMDDTGSIVAQRFQKVDVTAGFSEAGCPMDGPPDCEGSPVEHYLGKHGIGGMESVLSGSEEDIHLQSINVFFERLKNVEEAERLTEPSQVRVRKNREVMQEGKHCSDGQQASSTSLPENIPKLNCLPARGETAVGKETMEPVDTISNLMKTMKKDKPGSISPEPAASNSVLKTNPETRIFIAVETGTESRVNEATQSLDSPNGVETTPNTDKVMKVEMCTPLEDVKQGYLLTSQLTPVKKCSTDSWSDLETMTNVKWKEDPNVSQPDATSINKTASQESSPSASIRRKRKKKRRLSVEPTESMHGYERQVLVKQSDSEEEQYAWRGATGLCVPEDIHLFYSNEPQENVMASLAEYSATSDLPVKISANEIKVKDLSHYSPPCFSQYQYLPESLVREGRYKATGLTVSNVTNGKSVTPLRQTDNSIMSASNNSGNATTNLQPCSKLQVEESAQLKHPGVAGNSELDTVTAGFQQSDKINHSNMCCENEQNPDLCTAEVKSLTQSILPSAESNDPDVDVVQNDRLSAAKSVLAEEAGNSGGDIHTLCQREDELQQQLEIDCHYTDQYSSTQEKTHFPVSADGMNSPDAQVNSTKLTLDTSNLPSDQCCLFKSPSLDINITVRQKEYPLVCHALSKFDVLSEENTTTAELSASQIMDVHSENPMPSGEMNLTGKSQNPSDFTTHLSSCCTLDSVSVTSLSNENIADMSRSSCLSVSQNDTGLQEEKASLILTKPAERCDTSGPETSVSNDTTDSKCDLVLKAEDAIIPSKGECKPERTPDSKQSVFAMSSFWSEMEKLTIKDILRLRMTSTAAPPSSLPPLQESEENDVLTMMDSGFFNQMDKSKPEQSLGSVSSRGVMWESEPVPVSLGTDIYTENMMLTSVSDISQPVLPASAQTCHRKICKNVSVHNLHALESLSYTRKDLTLQTLEEGELEQLKYFPDTQVPKQDKDVDYLASSSADSYRISLTDVFQYFFGGKQSNPSQPATDNINTCYTDGNSVPETYDHFFSEFDTESFFYPLITAKDQAKDELVPVFSYSRAANRNFQFPEAYDYFFASSSSDDSAAESDEEENCAPVRVVNRFSCTSSSSKISTDAYDNFFTDRDLGHNFFWKNALSFRNISLTGSKVQNQSPSNSLVPVRQSASSFRTVYPMDALGNQGVMLSDPLLRHLEDRISIQLAQQPFRHEDLQIAVSNPRLDASLLPLKQSDMCLVCIAFASWVLKTANPQVGDAWKAVLLANVSALSAIRYLRKYVKMEAATGESKLNYTESSDF